MPEAVRPEPAPAPTRAEPVRPIPIAPEPTTAPTTASPETTPTESSESGTPTPLPEDGSAPTSEPATASNSSIQEDPPPTADQTAETQEQLARLETRKSQQLSEIGRMTSVIIQQRGKTLFEMSEAERQRAYASDPSSKDILSLYSLNNIAPEDWTAAKPPHGAPVGEDGRPLMVQRGGETLTVTHLKSTDGQTFVCRVNYGSHRGYGDEILTKDDIVKAQFLAVESSLIGSTQLSEAEKTIIGMSIAYTRGGRDTVRNLGDESTDRAIRTAAEDAGFPTVDVARGILATMSPEERAVREHGIQRIIEGRNLLDYPATVDLFRELGLDITENGLHGHIQKARAQLKKLEADGASIEDAAGARYQLKLLENAAKEFSNGKNPLASHFTRLEQGEINAEQSKQFIRALKNGDAESILTTALGDEWAGLPDKEKEKRLAMLHSFGGKTFNLFGIMGMLAFFGMGQLKEVFEVK